VRVRVRVGLGSGSGFGSWSGSGLGSGSRFESGSESWSGSGLGLGAAPPYNNTGACSVAALDDTWRIEMKCAFPGPTATRCCSCCCHALTFHGIDHLGPVSPLHYFCTETLVILKDTIVNKNRNA